MKTLILSISLIFIVLPGFAQLKYEGSVNSNYKTVQMEDGSLCFYDFNDGTNKLALYNLDGSTWKTINIPLKKNEYFEKVLLVSQKLINPDNLIEIAYSVSSYKSLPPNSENPEAIWDEMHYTLNILNEKGSTLLTIPESHLLKLSRTNGNNTLLIYKDAKSNFLTGEVLVYTLPEKI